MIVLENKHYEIVEFRGLPKRFAVDRKEPYRGSICLVNVAWCDTRNEAVRRMNEDYATGWHKTA